MNQHRGKPWIVRGGEDDSNSGNKHGGGGQGEGDDSGHSDTNGGSSR
ncbi:hypothetical protein ACQB60_05285 [Actinomycetota bacterium Odt1-20B]